MANNAVSIRPLGQFVQALTSAGRSLYQAPKSKINGIDETGWYSPGQPVMPMAPANTEPRRFQFWGGQNLIYTPRPDAEYQAADLQLLAKYPLAKACIENVCDMICELPWQIQIIPEAGETKNDRQKREQQDPTIKKLTQFFERPDGENSWDSWLRPLIQDMLIGDWASILIRKTFAGQLAELRVVAGESITRYIDQNGFTPKPPSPAYAQNWWGIPGWDLTTEQLIYRPRTFHHVYGNMASYLYGCSQTEQAAPEIKLGQERLNWVTNFFTQGSVPDAIQVVPPGVPPDKIKEQQDWQNSELAGNIAKRRQIRLMQGFQDDGKPDQFIFPKAEVLADAFDEMHIRKMCYYYGTSAQRLMKQMNRASSEQADSASKEENIRPYVMWLKTAIMDHIIQDVFGAKNYEIAFDQQPETDIVKQMQADTGYTAKAVETINESRAGRGLDPRPEPEADQLGVVTATGWVAIGALAAQAEAQQNGNGNAHQSQPGAAQNGNQSTDTPKGPKKKLHRLAY